MSQEQREILDDLQRNTEVVPEPPVLQTNLPVIRNHNQEDSSDMRQLGLAWAIPTSLVSPIIVMTLIGAKCDSMWHTSPNWTLTGVLIGTVAGFANMIKIVRRLNK